MYRNRAGQALVVMLLIMGVALTVGLSIASRSIIQVSISTAEDEAGKALEAAEAGVEKALGGVIAAGGSGSLPEADATYNVARTSVGGGSEYELPYPVEAGDVGTVNLEGFTGDDIRVCWGRGGYSGAGIPAVEVLLYFRDSAGNVGVGRNGYDPSSTPRAGFRGVTNAACGGLQGYSYRRRIYFANNSGDGLGMTVGASPIMLRVRLVYNSAAVPLAVATPGRTLPIQGSDIVSVGQAGDSTQRLRVIQAGADFPAVFDAALFSGGAGGLVQ